MHRLCRGKRHGPCPRYTHENHCYRDSPTRGHILRTDQHQHGWRERIAGGSWNELGVASNERFRLDRISVRFGSGHLIAWRDVVRRRDLLTERDLVGRREFRSGHGGGHV